MLLSEQRVRQSGLPDHGFQGSGGDVRTKVMRSHGYKAHLPANETLEAAMATLGDVLLSVPQQDRNEFTKCAVQAWHVTGNPTVESPSRFLPVTVPTRKRSAHFNRIKSGARRLIS